MWQHRKPKPQLGVTSFARHLNRDCAVETEYTVHSMKVERGNARSEDVALEFATVQN